VGFLSLGPRGQVHGLCAVHVLRAVVIRVMITVLICSCLVSAHVGKVHWRCSANASAADRLTTRSRETQVQVHPHSMPS